MSDDNLPGYKSGLVGPGSQPIEEDGASLSFMSMPEEMSTYRMPELSLSLGVSGEVNRVLSEIQQLLDSYQVGSLQSSIDVSLLDAQQRSQIDEILGEGEVSILGSGDTTVRIQESVLAGVWRVQYLTSDGLVHKDSIEVADIPFYIRGKTFSGNQIKKQVDIGQIPTAVNNAIPLLAEINDKINARNHAPHTINLTLLPQSDEDLEFLAQRLGKGKVTILSRGYGNCRVSSTATHNTWWVQYFNSQDAIILNTLEMTPVPSVVCASQEDIEDSAQRLHEIRQVYA